MLSLILFLLLLFPGSLTAAVLIRRKGNSIDAGECLAVGGGVNLLLLTAEAALLALIGAFKLILPVYALSVAATAAFLIIRRNRGELKGFLKSLGNRADEHLVLCIVLIVCGALYVFFPSEHLLGGRDYGLYAINAVHTAETGGSLYETDEVLESVYSELDRVISLSYPGYYGVYPALYSSYLDGTSDSPGDINAQFMSLYWCILAVGYSLGGLTLLIRISGIITVISLAVFYHIARYLAGHVPAVFATLAFGLCPAMLWGARITQSEQLALLISLLGIATWISAWKNQDALFLHAAVVMAGAGYFCRIDGYVIGIGLAAAFLVCCFTDNVLKKQMIPLVIHHALWTALSFAALFFFHRRYYLMHKNMVLGLIIVIAALTVLFFPVYFFSRSAFIKKHSEGMKRVLYVTLISGFSVFLVLMVISWFTDLIRPTDEYPVLQQYSWYISPFMLLAAVPGGYGLICTRRPWKDGSSAFEGHMFFIFEGIVCTMLYTLDPAVHMDHFWMSRRWLPVNYPFIILLAAAGLRYISLPVLKNRLRNLFIAVSVAVSLLILGYICSRDVFFYNKVSYADMKEDFDAAAADIPDDSIVLVRSEQLASIFKYMWGKNAYLIEPEYDAEQLRSYLAAHPEGLYYVGFPDAALGETRPSWGFDVEILGNHVITANAAERPMNRYPEEFFAESWDASVYHIGYSEADQAGNMLNRMHIKNPSEGDGLNAGVLEVAHLPNIVYGPYYELEAGDYVVTWIYEAAEDSEFDFRITCDSGDTRIPADRISADDARDEEGRQVASFLFRLDAPVSNAEFTTEIHSSDTVRIYGIRLSKAVGLP